MSEIVYFKINRFYDATDLAQDDMHIYIQWQNADGEYGATAEWIRDVESEPGYIIFGWPITSNITKSPGTIKFAVRFYKLDSDQKTIAYSFSTLNAQVSIKTSLNFNVNEIEADNMEDAILKRLVNSPLQGVELEQPEFSINLKSIENLDLDTGEKDLKVQAYAPKAAGTISYKAYNKDGEEIQDNLSGLTYFETADTERQQNKLYYIKDLTNGYTIYEGELPQDKTAEDRTIVYEQVYTVTVNSVGVYYIQAINTSKVTNRAQKTRNSVKCTIPGPTSLSAEISKTSALVGDELSVTASSDDNKDYVILSYQWKNASGDIADETERTFTPEAEGMYKAEVTNTLNKASISKETAVCRVTYAAKPPVLTCMVNNTSKTNGLPGSMISVNVEYQDGSRTTADTVAYQWYTHDVTEGEDLTKFKDGTYVVDTKVDKAISGATLQKYITKKNENDIFFCIVTNTYNGTTAQASSDLFYIVG